jgi:hypothetical protein
MRATTRMQISPRPRMRLVLGVIVCAGLMSAVVLGLGGCAADGESVGTTGGATAATAAVAETADAVGAPGDGAGGPGSGYAAAPTTTTPARPADDGATSAEISATTMGQKIISDAQLEIEVESDTFSVAFDRAVQIADRYGGYLVSSGSYAAETDDAGMKSGTVTIRVPSASFTRALSDASDLGKLKNRRVQTQDVTEEYVDLKARIANSEASVQALLALMAKAKTVDEILHVQQVLTSAQEQLEQLKGRLRYLDEHTSFSTLSLALFEIGTSVSPTNTGWGFTQALKDAVHNLVHAANAIVRALGLLVPVVVLLAIIAGIVYLAWRWLTRRRRERESRSYQHYPEGWAGAGTVHDGMKGDSSRSTPTVQGPAPSGVTDSVSDPASRPATAEEAKPPARDSSL